MSSLSSDQNAAISRVPVSLGDRSYDILIGADLLEGAGFHIEPVLRSKRVALITDETVAGIYLEKVQKSLKRAKIDHVSIVVPSGEGSKSFAVFQNILDQLLDAKIQRDEALIALGGGVIGDLTGFAAASLRRGVDFIQIPTTLLSQVDSSVGGKTGINTPQGKNLIGAFYQPKLVLADVCVLDSLPRRELLAGYAEVIKYGLLGNFDFFSWLEGNGVKVISGDAAARIYAVEQSVMAKARIVAEDEREGGVRALLNLGHTFGHALEAETAYNGEILVHGEAVAIGTIMAAELSARMEQLNGQDVARIKAHFAAIGLPASLSDVAGVAWNADALLGHMRQDKKIIGGQLTLILMKAIGDAFITQDVKEEDILAVLTNAINATA